MTERSNRNQQIGRVSATKIVDYSSRSYKPSYAFKVKDLVVVTERNTGNVRVFLIESLLNKNHTRGKIVECKKVEITAQKVIQKVIDFNKQGVFLVANSFYEKSDKSERLLIYRYRFNWRISGQDFLSIEIIKR